MIMSTRRLGQGVFVQSSAAWKTDCDSILQKTSEADSCDTGTDTARL